MNPKLFEKCVAVLSFGKRGCTYVQESGGNMSDASFDTSSLSHPIPSSTYRTIRMLGIPLRQRKISGETREKGGGEKTIGSAHNSI